MADTRITIDAQIQMRHDTEANWMAADPVLRVGEPAYTIGMPDRFKIGDGQRKWSELPYLTMLEEDPEGPALPALGELADVEIEQPVEGQALVYDEVRGMWVNRAVAAPDDEPESGPVFEFIYDTTTNKATAEMVAALAEAIAADKLIVCNGRTYKFILEQDEMYGLVSDTYLDIMDGKLKASVLAVMALSYDVQLMEEEVPVGTEITEETVRGWGFTKNVGTITGIMMNGATKGTSGVVDLGNVLTEHQKLKDINGQSIVGEGNITIQGGGATPRVEMTAASAAIEPNNFYVWPMMDALDLTLGAETSGVMNRYLFQFRNPKAGLTMLTLPDTITWSEDTELDENGMPVMEAAAFYRIEIIEGLASLKKWKLVYIQFADAEVERVLMSNGVGDGIGITKRDAKAVTSIGTWFKGNTIITSFEELQYFKNVVTLYDSAFDRCVNLESVDISNVRTLDGRFHFRECASLKGVIDAPYLTSISEDGFQGTAIDGINAPMVTEVGWNAFRNCGNLKSAVFGDVLTTLYERAFENCTALTSIDVSHVTQLVGRKHFRNCSSLEGVMQFPYLTIISEECFQNAKIEGVNAPMVTEIGWNAFQNCWNMKSAIFGEALTAIYGDAFHSASSLTEIVIRATTPPSLTNTRALENTNNCPIYVPDASVEAYKSATNWDAFASRIKGISEYTG